MRDKIDFESEFMLNLSGERIDELEEKFVKPFRTESTFNCSASTEAVWNSDEVTDFEALYIIQYNAVVYQQMQEISPESIPESIPSRLVGGL